MRLRWSTPCASTACLTSDPHPHTLVRAQLNGLREARCTVEGFIPPRQIREHFRAADLIIGKPGPGVVAEALVCGLPYVAESSMPMSQEVCVLDYLRESGVGVLVPSLEALPPELLSRCEVARKKAQLVDNQAIFELADFLADGGFVGSRLPGSAPTAAAAAAVHGV